jgi:hypothetical protein
VNEVTSDLQALANLELPARNNKVGRNVVKVTILCFSATIFLALLTVSYALWASLHREDSLQDQLSCNRESSVLFDGRIGEGLVIIIDNDATVLQGLNGIAQDDPNAVAAALARVDSQLLAGEQAKINIDQAMTAREEALNTC